METIIREKITYGLVLFDKYILCNIKNGANFRRLDKIGKKPTKIKQYNSLKALRNEALENFQYWFYPLTKHKENEQLKNKVEPWWDEIYTLESLLKEAGFNGLSALNGWQDTGAWDYCIEHKYFKIIKIKEKLIFEE